MSGRMRGSGEHAGRLAWLRVTMALLLGAISAGSAVMAIAPVVIAQDVAEDAAATPDPEPISEEPVSEEPATVPAEPPVPVETVAPAQVVETELVPDGAPVGEDPVEIVADPVEVVPTSAPSVVAPFPTLTPTVAPPPATVAMPAGDSTGGAGTGTADVSTAPMMVEGGQAPADRAATTIPLDVVAPAALDLPGDQGTFVAAIEDANPNATVVAVVFSDTAHDAVAGADVPTPELHVTEEPVATAAAILVGDGVTFSNAQFTGDPRQLGSFSGGTRIIGFESGIILSSGNVADVIGPNDSTGKSTNFQGPGDAQLSGLVEGQPTYDAAILTLDFVPIGNTVTFQYVFSSEEYLEYVNAGYTDVFAFYVNGENCATVNGDNITVDNINTGTNAGMFVNNTDGHLNTQMDGLTVVLTCTAPVNAGQTNTLRLAIADVGDGFLDSAVFIQSKSFAVPTSTPTVTPVTPDPTATSTIAPEVPTNTPTVTPVVPDPTATPTVAPEVPTNTPAPTIDPSATATATAIATVPSPTCEPTITPAPPIAKGHDVRPKAPQPVAAQAVISSLPNTGQGATSVAAGSGSGTLQHGLLMAAIVSAMLALGIVRREVDIRRRAGNGGADRI